ncbi:MAG: signal peptidase II [Salinisphaeraceae bacterium]|nr:signal peptidase II [Salinisphaeraceae bacterium]
MTATPNNRPMRRTLPLLLAAALLAAGTDLATKSWAQAMLAGQPPLPLLGETLRLHLGFNTGVAFSLFAGGGLFVPLLNLAVLSGFCVWLGLLLRRQSLGPGAGLCAGLFLGGGIANLLDRLVDGRVTDFIDVGVQSLRWPTFNLADIFIVMGALAFVLLLERQPASGDSPPASGDG